MTNDSPGRRIGTEDFVPETTAQAFLELLQMRGVRYLMANSGTDFPAIVDALARRAAEGRQSPQPVVVPHEIPLIAMAHGHYLATGRPVVVMVHVGVGTANALGGVMAAARARIPMLVCAGRTPIHESGHPACRSAYIQWGQESFDQAAMLREYVKWDYELRSPAQLEAAIDRALALAQSDPKGPVYLTLPREILAARPQNWPPAAQARYDLPSSSPDQSKVARLATWLAAAENPLLITASAGRTPQAVEALVALAEAAAMAVVSFNPEFMNFPLEHACHQGFSPWPRLQEADLVLVADADVPWYPDQMVPPPDARVVHLGIDPLQARLPMRTFPADLTLQGHSAQLFSAITEALKACPGYDPKRMDQRMRVLADMNRRMRTTLRDALQQTCAGGRESVDFRQVAASLRDATGEDAVLVDEYDNHLREYVPSSPRSYFGVPHAGYLGWGLGAALGIKLAWPERMVAAVVGDGSYIFGVPTAAHWVSAVYELPLLVVINNNQRWDAVRRATIQQYPEGHAAKSGLFPLTDLSPSPAYEQVVTSVGGHAERVSAPEQVLPALKRAVEVVRNEKRQAVVNVISH